MWFLCWHDVCGGSDATGNQGNSALYRGNLTAGLLLCNGIQYAFFVLVSVSGESMEPSKTAVCNHHVFDRHRVRNLYKSNTYKVNYQDFVERV